MKLSRGNGDVTGFQCGLLVIGRFEEGQASAAETAIDEALGGSLSAASARLLFTGKARQSVELDTLGRIEAAKVMLVGLGRESELTISTLRDFAALGISEALAGRFGTVGIVAPRDQASDAIHLASGARLGAYRFNDLQAEPEDAPRPRVEIASILGGSGTDDDLTLGADIATGVNLARTLTNEPANICTPERFEALAREIATAPGFELTVLTSQT